MPRGIRNTQPTLHSVAPAPVAEPTPLIMLQPHGDGIQFNAYGLEIPEMVDALRLAIVHLVGKQAGIKVFDEVISRSQRVWVPPGAICDASHRAQRQWQEARQAGHQAAAALRRRAGPAGGPGGNPRRDRMI